MNYPKYTSLDPEFILEKDKKIEEIAMLKTLIEILTKRVDAMEAGMNAALGKK